MLRIGRLKLRVWRGEAKTRSQMDLPTLTVLSWNLFLGSGAPRNVVEHVTKHWNVFFFERGPRLSLEPLAAFIRTHDCDVVCLQEVDGGSWRNGYRNVFAELQALTGLTHGHFAAQRHLHCNDGIAVLSRYPLQELSTTVLAHDFEQRGLIQARVVVEGHTVNIAVTHLSALPFNASLRRRQATQIAHALDAKCPTVLAADVNCDTNADELRPLTELRGLRPLVSTATFPIYRPRYRFDNVFADTAVTVLDARVLDAPYSDHLPVLAKIELRAQAAAHRLREAQS